jgi:hypothetical protein
MVPPTGVRSKLQPIRNGAELQAGGVLGGDGDLDGDNDVDLSDLAALLTGYGTTCE